MQNHRAMLVIFGAALLLHGQPSSAAYIAVYGGPAFDQTTQTGYEFDDFLNSAADAGNGFAAGFADLRSGLGHTSGERAVRWDASGSATEMGNLGTGSSGETESQASVVNASGVAVGYADKWLGTHNLGARAVRWDASGTVTELGNLGTDSFGDTECYGQAVNSAGTAAGYAEKYNGSQDLGTRAVRWDSSGTLATELGNIGTNSSGVTNCGASAVNDAGVVVGYGEKYSGNTDLGGRAVRWDASGTATELGNLGTGAGGTTSAAAGGINSAGTTVGVATKYSGGVSVGNRAVRWAASGTAATELGNLGTSLSGSTNCQTGAINNLGTAVGFATKYVGGVPQGTRAVRWSASGTAATELTNLGTASNGTTTSHAFAINNTGITVGDCEKYVTGTDNGDHAVAWDAAGNLFDLNNLIDPTSGWTFTVAYSISDTNWVAGIGTYDPDGAGPLTAYDRGFLLNVSSIVPEPSGIGLLAAAATGLLRQRRRKIEK